jgi:hypothetical protein
VVVEGGALLFLGHSTAGKSTIARLLGEVAPVLADDSVYAFRGEDGEWRVVEGGFRFGDGSVSGWQASIQQRIAEGGLRLGGCFRLHKAAKTGLKMVSPWQTARYLMDAAMEIDVQRKGGLHEKSRKIKGSNILHDNKMREKWFQMAADIARKTIGCDFHANLHENTNNLKKILTTIQEHRFF